MVANNSQYRSTMCIGSVILSRVHRTNNLNGLDTHFLYIFRVLNHFGHWWVSISGTFETRNGFLQYYESRISSEIESYFSGDTNLPASHDESSKVTPKHVITSEPAYSARTCTEYQPFPLTGSNHQGIF